MLWARADVQTIVDLLGRYWASLAHAWRERQLNEASPRIVHELAFLPAHLELTESPPHPAPLWTARLLLLAIVLVLLIAIFGELDTVAVAPGQLIPNANVKIVQPAVSGVVRRILVQNGERVTAGQLLMDLDGTLITARSEERRVGKEC